MSHVIVGQILKAKRQLQKLFPGKLIRCSVIINEDDQIRYYAQVLTSTSDMDYGEQSWVDFQDVIDRLVRQAKISSVEQYIRLTHTHYCETCNQIYDYPFNVVELKGHSSFGVLNCCHDCEMTALYEFEEHEKSIADMQSQNGAA